MAHIVHKQFSLYKKVKGRIGIEIFYFRGRLSYERRLVDGQNVIRFYVNAQGVALFFFFRHNGNPSPDCRFYKSHLFIHVFFKVGYLFNDKPF